MKKQFLVVVLLGLALSSMAAELPKQGFGVQIGWAQPILRLNDYSYAISQKDSLGNIVKLNGLKVGLVYDASFVKGFGTSMGINYTFAGLSTPWEKKSYDISHSICSSTIYNELEVFVDWQYKFEVAKETYLILTTGPTIQCGLTFNKHTLEREDFDDQITKDETYNRYATDKTNEGLQRLNVTWGLGAGFQYKRYYLRGGYDFGLINPNANKQFINPVTGEQYDRYTRGRLDQWSIKLGVYIWYQK